ncbi:TspO protein [Niastella koreensis]|uniref:TspO and MBR like protein n=2 Tax=Niastella koreensis TaxID=354356 RepID=G8TKH0_NIAKG|nr:TspO/MBR family protein [Niastella koreensis]AEV97626.1 TspO and MBR like protein [Niastella koreensis GR20-10]OQP40548.1 TspO protein [Niastella koreensis]
MNKWLTILLCIGLPLAVGGVSAYVTIQNVQSWYPGLVKPFFNPPNTVFGPVWTVLYILMGISFYLVLRKPSSEKKKHAIILFLIQLLLNFWWSILFFRFHLTGIALVDIVLLWLFIILMIRRFYQVSGKAANLQWPYLAWVSFASVLNASVWYLNH